MFNTKRREASETRLEGCQTFKGLHEVASIGFRG